MNYKQLPVGQVAAKKAGSTFYQSTKPCKRCPTPTFVRYTSNGRCLACAKDSTRECYEAHREMYLASQARWREKNPDYFKKYREEHPEMYISHFKYMNKDKLDSQWDEEDDELLLELILKRNKLRETTGKQWMIRRTALPFRATDLILVESDKPYRVKPPIQPPGRKGRRGR